MLAKNKLNSIETLLNSLIDMKIIHEEFFTVLNEKDNYEKAKMKNTCLMALIAKNA